LDEYVDILNSRKLCLSYTEGDNSVIYVNKTSAVKTAAAIYGIVKATLFDKKTVYLLGKKSKLLALFADYL
jgi:superfamily II RNA helicase